MADGIFNISKGRFIQQAIDNPNNFLLVLLKVAEADATLEDYDTLAALLAGSNTEADATNYARKTGLTGTPAVDDTNNWRTLDISDQTFTSLGGATNNTLVKAIVCFEESASDAGRIPVSHHDISVTTDGTDLTLQIHADGIAKAA